MKTHSLFTRFGVELEYMIVDADTLDVRPVADELLKAEGGSYDEDVRRGPVEWSNELALHVIELKTARPRLRLTGLDGQFHHDIRHINRMLARRGCRLLPGGMHPWMNPGREGRLWPHACQDIYEAFHRIFDCRRHGWMNLQSTHLNLPFANDREFARLHAAVRLILPLIPALGASSPFMEGRVAENLDQRLEVYRQNCRRVPSVSGRVVPEPIRTRRAYQQHIFNRIYRDLEGLDPEGILREEWVNARGAIARFSRNTIEIRLLDMQECPAVDVAIVECLVAVLRRLVRHGSLEAQFSISTEYLQTLLRRTTRNAGATRVAHPGYFRCFGIPTRQRMTVRELWSGLLDQCTALPTDRSGAIRFILREGSLAERLRRAAGDRPSRQRLRCVYRRLADCLDTNERFEA
jgi:gamma-glutamyl:cysteine ligase YbdK (ATP-grasp superfamily)